MVALADVLETLHETHRAFESLRARGHADGLAWRLWWAGPRRVRVEREKRQHSAVERLVVNGDAWWIAEPDGSGITNRGNPDLGLGLGMEVGILYTRHLLGEVILEVVAEERIANRPAVVLAARARTDPRHSRWWGYAERFEVAVDLETGTALRTPRLEVTEATFDETFADVLFEEPNGINRWRR